MESTDTREFIILFAEIYDTFDDDGELIRDMLTDDFANKHLATQSLAEYNNSQVRIQPFIKHQFSLGKSGVLSKKIAGNMTASV